MCEQFCNGQQSITLSSFRGSWISIVELWDHFISPILISLTKEQFVPFRLLHKYLQEILKNV